jgi:hypothetical protein
MEELTKMIILRVIQRAPQWLRHDLEAKDSGVRARAEETLTAMIENAIKGGQSGTRGSLL